MKCSRLKRENLKLITDSASHTEERGKLRAESEQLRAECEQLRQTFVRNHFEMTM